MTDFVHDDFARIMYKAARKYSSEEYKNVDIDVVVNKVLVSFRAHLKELEEETDWKFSQQITDKFLLTDTVDIPDSEQISCLLTFLRNHLKKARTP